MDLRAVPRADSAGVRALVRGHTSAQRLYRRFTLIGPNARVLELLHLSLLDRVLEIKDSIAEVPASEVRWDRLLTIGGVLMVSVVLVGASFVWPTLGLPSAVHRARRRSYSSHRSSPSSATRCSSWRSWWRPR